MTDEKEFKQGKKIFFAYPTYVFETTVIERLKTLEYEVYPINDYKILKNLLLKNPDSFLIANIDAGLSKKGWRNFFGTFAQSRRLMQVTTGVVTEKLTDHDMESFKSGLTFNAGIYFDGIKSEKSMTTLVQALDRYEAKGMRNFVRAFCFGLPNAEVYWIDGDRMNKLRIIDISAAGMAIHVPAASLPAVQGKEKLQDIKLVLGQKTLTVDLDIYKLQPNKGNFLMVTMFPLEIEKEKLAYIRSFVQETLWKKLFAEVDGLPIDKTDYANLA